MLVRIRSNHVSLHDGSLDTLEAVREAAAKAKKANEDLMGEITGGMDMGLPGFM